MLKINETKLLKMVDVKDFESIKTYLLEEIQVQAQTSSSNKQKVKAFMSLSKRIDKSIGHRQILKGIRYHNDRSYLCDGYRIIEFNGKIEGLENTEDNYPIKLLELIDTIGTDKEIKISAAALVAQYKEYKATKEESLKYFIITTDDLRIKFNIQYLYDLSKLFDLDSCTIKASTPEAPIIIDDGTNRALQLPVRPE